MKDITVALFGAMMMAMWVTYPQAGFMVFLVVVIMAGGAALVFTVWSYIEEDRALTTYYRTRTHRKDK